jgi:hypothetical protein
MPVPHNTTVGIVSSSSVEKTKSAGSVSWGIFLLFLYAYRCIYSVFDELVIMRITPISDTRGYQLGQFEQEGRNGFLSNYQVALTDWSSSQAATGITAKVGELLNTLFSGNPILINIGFQTITFIGIAYLLMAIEPRVRLRFAPLMFLPSFSVWTSMASKESIVVFCTGILLGYFVKQYYGKSKISWYHILAFVLLYLFKAQYVAAFIYAILGTWVCQQFRQKALAALLGGVTSLGLLYFVRDLVGELAMKIQWSYDVGGTGGSSRTEPFFTGIYDVFWKAPEGMLLAFIGPTVTEALSSPLHLVTFVESIFLLGLLAFFLLKRLMDTPMYSWILGMFSIFWILFPNYPFGVMNPGTAIRYRSGWLLVVIFFVTVFMSRNIYAGWDKGLRRRATPVQS